MESKKRIGTSVVFNIDYMFLWHIRIDDFRLFTWHVALFYFTCMFSVSPVAVFHRLTLGFTLNVCVQSRKERPSAHCLRHRAYTSAFIASINIHPSVSKGISNNTSDNKSSSIFSIDNRATNFIHTKLCKLVYWIMIYTEEISLILQTLYVERRNIHHFLIACQRFSSARW